MQKPSFVTREFERRRDAIAQASYLRSFGLKIKIVPRRGCYCVRTCGRVHRKS